MGLPSSVTALAVPEAASVFGLSVVVQRAAGVTGGGAVSLRIEVSDDGATWDRLMATNTGGAVVSASAARVRCFVSIARRAA